MVPSYAESLLHKKVKTDAFKNSRKRKKAEVAASVCLRRAVEPENPGLEVRIKKTSNFTSLGEPVRESLRANLPAPSTLPHCLGLSRFYSPVSRACCFYLTASWTLKLQMWKPLPLAVVAQGPPYPRVS